MQRSLSAWVLLRPRGVGGGTLSKPRCCGVDGGHLPGRLSYQALSAGHPPSPGTSFPEGQVDSLLSIISSQRERFRARNQELEGVGGVGRAAGGGCGTHGLELDAFMTCREFIISAAQAAPQRAREKYLLLLGGAKPPPARRGCSRSRTGPNPCRLPGVRGHRAQRSGAPYKKHVGNVVWGKKPTALQTEVQLKMTSSKQRFGCAAPVGARSQPKATRAEAAAAHAHPWRDQVP